MANTKYAYLTDTELISIIEDKRAKSPIIKELCDRLEGQIQEREVERELIPACCPVCEAELAIPSAES